MLSKFKPTFLYYPDPPPPAGDPPAPPPASPPPAPPPETEDPPPGPVPYDRFKKVNDELVASRKRLEKLEADQKKAADQEAAAKGEWEKLAKQHEAELKAEKTARLRLEVASRKGIPVDLVDRLKGETAEDMEADAIALLAFLKPAESKGVPPPKRNAAPVETDLSKLTPAEVRAKAKGKPLNELA